MELIDLIIQIKKSSITIRFLPDSTDDPKYLDLAKQEAEIINQQSNFLLKKEANSKPRALKIYVKGLKASATKS